MSAAQISLSDTSLEGCEAFLAELDGLERATRIDLRLADMPYWSPFGMLVISYALSRLRADRPHCAMNVLNFEHQTYPAHMGFFKAFGADFGKLPGEALGGDRYLPITLLAVDKMRQDAVTQKQRVQNYIEDQAVRMSRLLLQGARGDIEEALAFSLREILRNVVEHSDAHTVGYCGQYWPSKGIVEVGVLDSGIGIRSGLSRNPHWRIHSNTHALHLSLLPGVSGAVFRGRAAARDDEWANAGYGLYMTSGICREAGSFLICSGETSLTLEGRTKKYRALSLPGTAIRMRIKLASLPRLSELRSRLLRDGDRLAKRLKGTVPSPEAASRMVREGSGYVVD